MRCYWVGLGLHKINNYPWGTGGGIDYKYHLKFLANAINCSDSAALGVAAR